MRDAARDPVTLRLMETPLQVTIMSFIVQKFPTLPPDRFTLFDMYYRTMFDREVAKDTPIARFLSQHSTQIHRLHEHVGLNLQAASEAADGAEATISPQELHGIARQRLLDRGFAPADAESHAEALVEAATHRLVLLGPRDNGVGFDIRTLQELMAAHAISEGDDAVVMSRLRLIAHHPHWRNTWLLAAGELLVRSERFERKILDLLKQIDSDPQRLNARYPTAPALAADVLDDNLAAKRPRFERGLIERLLTILDRPPVVHVQRLATTLLRIASTDTYRRLVYDRISSAASAGSARRAASALVLEEMSREVASHDARLTSMLNAFRGLAIPQVEMQAIGAWLVPLPGFDGSDVHFRVLGRMTHLHDPAPETVPLPVYVGELVERVGSGDKELQVLRSGLAPLSDSRFYLSGPPPGTAIPVFLPSGPADPLVQALQNEDVAASLDLALSALPSTHWTIEAMLGATLKPSQDRHPVGPPLLHAIAEEHTTDNYYAD
ncbi:hypothetical protein [Streptomyces sp. NPDC058644]|uniref:hypothetical protein n=1 Tax=unclassified Streptomyces TaxID=2593676 RepID=UPI00365ED02C